MRKPWKEMKYGRQDGRGTVKAAKGEDGKF